MIEIKILGTGCPNCERLEKNARKALAGLAMNATVTKVTDMQDILTYDIISTPGLVIDERVVASGRVPNPNEITTMITTALTAEDA